MTVIDQPISLAPPGADAWASPSHVDSRRAQATPEARLLAGLIDGNAPAEPPVGVAVATVIQGLRANKVGLISVADAAPRWIADAPAFQEALADERAALAEQHREYVMVRDAWLARGIECVMLKSAGNPPAFPYTSDNIDILVRPARGLEARDILRGLGYADIRTVEEPHKYLFRKFVAGRSVSAIHVHEQVAWLVGFMDEAALWARSRVSQDDPHVAVPSPEDAILINLAHACYENKVLRLNDTFRVRFALRQAGASLDWGYMRRVATRRGWVDGLRFMLLVYASLEDALFERPLLPPDIRREIEADLRRDGPAWQHLAALQARQPYPLPFKLGFLFCKRLYYRKIMADGDVPSLRRVRDAAMTFVWGIKLKSRLRPQPGMVIAFSGPDGAGKSAHAQALVDALRLSEVTTTYVWSRGGSTGLVGMVNRGLGRLRGGSDGSHQQPQAASGTPNDDTVTRRRRRLTHPLVRFAWAWLVAVDQLVSTVLRATLPAWCGRVVVADRYLFDTAVEMDASLPTAAPWSRLAIRALLRLAPRPNLTFVLDSSLETAAARKPDECWQADYDRQRAQYATLARRFGARLISTEGEFARSNNPIVRDALMAFMQRFETPLNGLFWANPSQHNALDPVWVTGGSR